MCSHVWRERERFLMLLGGVVRRARIRRFGKTRQRTLFACRQRISVLARCVHEVFRCPGFVRAAFACASSALCACQ